MMIVEISPSQVLDNCIDYFRLRNEGNDYELLLIQLLRRSAGITCPCSRSVLRNSVLKSLSYLPIDSEELAGVLDGLIEKLIIVGDLLELSDVSIDEQSVSGSWIFAAPPSFVRRSSGSVILLGIVPDHESFLNSDLEERIKNNHVLRQIEILDNEEIEAQLIDQGLNELSESAWLKAPRTTTPEKLLTSHNEKLELKDNYAEIEGLQILDTTTDVSYYRGRWSDPSKQEGRFVARRPQQYGSPLWCYVVLSGMVVQKLLDLPLKGYRWRGCDAAWHLQMAIDSVNGRPQRYSKLDIGDGIQFEFYSPIPLWIQRRLMILGRETKAKKGMLAFVIPYAEAEQEENNLRETLWLDCEEISMEGL